MATNITFFHSFLEALAEKRHNLGSDTLKIMLSNTAPNTALEVKADITEIAAGNGYTAGGTAVTVLSSAVVSGVYQLTADPVVFTATGAVGPFRYAVIYNDSAANDELIGWWDYGSSISLADTETFTIAPGTGNVLISLAAA